MPYYVVNLSSSPITLNTIVLTANGGAYTYPDVTSTIASALTAGTVSVTFIPSGSAVGATGPLGNTGATGPAGIRGVPGGTGPLGATGGNGVRGPEGPDGIRGPTGNTGPAGGAGVGGGTGTIGGTGSQGLRGFVGPAGPTGPTGATGSTGSAGTNGTNGAVGATGAQGLQGFQGVTGSTGASAATGATGATGASTIGAPGIQGSTGATGAAGTVGTQGVPGTIGSTGATGSTGAAGGVGIQGIQGTVGAAGITGISGSTGPTGSTGGTGATGPRGFDGVQGDAGNPGIQGVQGVQGTLGAAGAPGLPGVRGATGATGLFGSTGATGEPGGNGTYPTNGSLSADPARRIDGTPNQLGDEYFNTVTSRKRILRATGWLDYEAGAAAAAAAAEISRQAVVIQVGIASTKADIVNIQTIQTATNAAAVIAQVEVANAAAAALVNSAAQSEVSRQNSVIQAGIATTRAVVATTQAGIATTQAGISTAQAIISGVRAGNALQSSSEASVHAIVSLQAAENSQIAATASEVSRQASRGSYLQADSARVQTELARDAAQLSAGVYPNVATGLAATIPTKYFSTPSPDNNEYLILYRHDEGSVAVEIKRYPSVSGIEYTVANVLHVKANGSDSKNGRTWRTALRTIEHALALATAAGTPTLIEWAPESPVYTQGHLDMPDDCVIKAAHRTVFLRPLPGFEERNVFRMGSGCFLEGVMFEGWKLDSLTNPTSGFAVSFRPGAVITRVPYAHKIAVRCLPNWGLVAPPLDRVNGNPEVPIGGGVILADGLVCSQYSKFPNIMTWGATPVIPNGIGYCAKNGALINAVNAVSMWAHKHFVALSGGQVILSSCSTQFGDYTLQASGYRNIVIPSDSGAAVTQQTAAGLTVTTNKDYLINTMWTALVNGGYTVGWTTGPGNTLEAKTRSDAALLLQCVRWTLDAANQQPMKDFASGHFNVLGEHAFAPQYFSAYLFAFENLRSNINSMAGVSAAAKVVITGLFAALSYTLNYPVRRKEPSRITAIGHTWTAVMSGVALTKVPPALNKSSIQDSILEENEGVVIASGQDDQGNALFVGGLQINADTGELGGPPFEQAVRRVATRAAIARSF